MSTASTRASSPSTATFTISASLLANPPFDIVRDFQAVTLLASAPFYLMTHPSLPVKTVKELTALARAAPDKFNVSLAGAGTPTITSTGNLDLSSPSAVRVTGGGLWQLPSLTSAQIANLAAANGSMVYNTTTSKIQAYAAGAWGNITLT